MTNVTYAGDTTFGTAADLGGGAGGRTFADPTPSSRILCNGSITSIKIRATSSGSDPTQVKVKAFRPNGSNWNFVAESNLFTLLSGDHTYTLSIPVAGVNPGDIVGLYESLDTGLAPYITETSNSGTNVLYSDADLTGSNFSFGHTITVIQLQYEAYGSAPVACMTGDSIENGSGSTWKSYFYGGADALQGDPSCELGYQMRQILSNWNYINFSLGSQTYAWVRSTGIPAMLTGAGTHSATGYGMSEIWIHCGVNDIATGRPWASVQADLDAIYSLVGATPLFLNEVAPWVTASTGSDANAATTRTFNTNLATWAVGKATVRIVPVWAALGVFWASTGLNDKLNPLYDSGDGIHPNAVGASVIATQRASSRLSYYGSGNIFVPSAQGTRYASSLPRMIAA